MVRPDHPTVFEYYRKAKGAAKESTWLVTGKTNNAYLDWGLDPSFSSDYASMISVTGSDSKIFARVDSVLTADQPKLVMVNFADVDDVAHKSSFTDYLEAIELADQLVYRLWTENIQGNPVYRDKTTLMVTSDHGRHDEGFGGFANHGGVCHGDRHIPFLAIGPDTPADKVVTDRRYQTDIAPTVGELLGFETPLARGQTLTGMLKTDLNPDPRLHTYATGPKIALHNGMVYVVYAQNTPDDSGNSGVYFTRKAVNSSEFEPALRIDGPARWAYEPDLQADETGVHIAWTDGRALDERGETWSIFYRRSLDQGATFETERLVVTTVIETDAKIYPAITISPSLRTDPTGRITILHPVHHRRKPRLSGRSSTDGGLTWSDGEYRDALFPRFCTSTSLKRAKGLVAAWIDPAQTSEAPEGEMDWELYVDHWMNGETRWGQSQRVTLESGFSYQPSVAYGGDTVLLAWAERSRDPAGEWEVVTLAVGNGGEEVSEVQRISGGQPGWQPDVVYNEDEGYFYITWTSFRPLPNRPRLRYRRSADGRNWGSFHPAPSPLFSGAIQRNSVIDADAGRVYIAWEEEDPVNGNWFIRAEEMD